MHKFWRIIHDSAYKPISKIISFVGLVTCDSLHIIFAILEAVRASWFHLYHTNLLFIFPFFHYPFYRITLVSSIYLMIAVSIERYFAVCCPHNYHNMTGQRNRSLYYIVPAIAAALLICIPKFFEVEVTPRQVNKNKQSLSRKMVLVSNKHSKLYQLTLPF